MGVAAVVAAEEDVGVAAAAVMEGKEDQETVGASVVAVAVAVAGRLQEGRILFRSATTLDSQLVRAVSSSRVRTCHSLMRTSPNWRML